MAGFTIRAYGSAHYSQTIGVLFFSLTEGTASYVLNDSMPGFVTARDKIHDGALVYYTARSGIHQEIGSGTFSYSGNTITRNTIEIPNDGTPLNWGPGRKLINIMRAD
jgi:hypothetical protein